MSDYLEIIRPDDWHIHLRDGEMMQTVVPHSARAFGRIMVMPNLTPPVTTVDQALEYRQRILDAAEQRPDFDPVMTLYLTDNTPIETVRAAAASSHVVGFKLYPAGATTNSDSGVTSINNVMSVLEEIAAQDLVLQVHGEVTDQHIDVFDREAEFIDQILLPLHQEIPELRIVFEHITTTHAVDFVRSTPANIGATITPQHLLYCRNDLFVGGIRPHFYCLPILKRHEHRVALLDAVSSGNTSFFLGTDSAPHLIGDKESSCGCAGIYSAHAAIEIYTEIFEAIGALDKLEGFTSKHGADFYRWQRNAGTIKLQRVDWTIPNQYRVGDSSLVPMRAGETLRWKLVD